VHLDGHGVLNDIDISGTFDELVVQKLENTLYLEEVLD